MSLSSPTTSSSQHLFAILPRLLAAALLFSGLCPVAAQTAGTLKNGYNPPAIPNDGSLVSTAQADGKIIVGSSSALVRLNTDGSVDAGFSAPAGLGRIVSLASGPNLKTVVITTAPASSDAYNDFYLLRLQANGAADPVFTPVTLHGTSDPSELSTFTLAVQLDEKVLVAGELSVLIPPDDYTFAIRIVRYNSNGSLDTTFSDPFSSNSSVIYNALVPLANGKILVAGCFVIAYHMVYYQDGLIALLNADGTVAESYVSTSGDVSGMYAPTLLPDGGIVYLADFSPTTITGPSGPLGGVPRRLNADFTPDTSFAPQFATGASFTLLVVQSNGKLVIGGYTASGDGTSQSTSASGVLRLNADGSMDVSFNPGAGANEGGAVNSTYVVPDGSIVVGGFSTFDGQPRNGIAALYGDGGLSEPFFNGEFTLSDGFYYLALPDGNPFGFYAFLDDPHYLYHVDLGFEYVIEASDSQNGLYLYDFESNGFFYTSSSFPFPYLYDFTLNTVLYYYPDPNPNHVGRYNTDGVRYFYDFATGQIITK